jgi:hypothetical protein
LGNFAQKYQFPVRIPLSSDKKDYTENDIEGCNIYIAVRARAGSHRLMGCLRVRSPIYSLFSQEMANPRKLDAGISQVYSPMDNDDHVEGFSASVLIAPGQRPAG